MFKSFLEGAISNISQSFNDRYYEVNVDKRIKAGVKQVIVRRQVGVCCDYCAELSGVYDYDKRPDDIFMRHRYCKCMVLVKSEKSDSYKDAWNKKETRTQKEARIRRIAEIQEEEKISEKYDRIKRRLKSQGKKVYDATEEWFEKAKPNDFTLSDKNSITYNGIKYEIDGKNIVLDLKDDEIKSIKAFGKTFGGYFELCPRILIPEGVSTPDFFMNGIRFDLKSPGKNKPASTNTNTLLNAIQRKKKQADCFLFDTTRAKMLSRDDFIKQAEALYSRDKTKFVNTIVLMDENGVYKVLEKL